jgi:hypothetical protein
MIYTCVYAIYHIPENCTVNILSISLLLECKWIVSQCDIWNLRAKIILKN